LAEACVAAGGTGQTVYSFWAPGTKYCLSQNVIMKLFYWESADGCYWNRSSAIQGTTVDVDIYRAPFSAFCRTEEDVNVRSLSFTPIVCACCPYTGPKPNGNSGWSLSGLGGGAATVFTTKALACANCGGGTVYSFTWNGGSYWSCGVVIDFDLNWIAPDGCLWVTTINAGTTAFADIYDGVVICRAG